MKKVYITSLHLMHGGVEMAVTLLANAFTEYGYDVEILCTYNLGQPVYKLDDRVKVTYLTDVRPNREEFRAAIKSKNPFKILKEGLYSVKVLRLKKSTLIKKFKEIQDGIIVSTRNEHSVLLSKYGNDRVKKIAQLHHDHLFDRKLLSDFKNNYKNIDVFTLLTDRLSTEAREIMKNNNRTKIVTMPNFLEDVSMRKAVVRERQVIAVGRLHTVKGFDRLIELWKSVDFSEPAVLKIVGDGDEKERLEMLIKENNLQNRVILTGAMPHDKVMEEMSKSLFYVMTSYSEGFPFVVIEAMLMGLPVVAFDVRVGPEAIIEHEKNGYLVPDNDNSAFAKKVELLASDRELLERMSESAVKRSRDFSKENIMKIWLDILEH
jgi:glycosyltransferase involved in cell wall biosynthesis